MTTGPYSTNEPVVDEVGDVLPRGAAPDPAAALDRIGTGLVEPDPSRATDLGEVGPVEAAWPGRSDRPTPAGPRPDGAPVITNNGCPAGRCRRPQPEIRGHHAGHRRAHLVVQLHRLHQRSTAPTATRRPDATSITTTVPWRCDAIRCVGHRPILQPPSMAVSPGRGALEGGDPLVRPSPARPRPRPAAPAPTKFGRPVVSATNITAASGTR